MIKRSTIQVSEDLRKELAELGHKGETYEIIIKRLIRLQKETSGVIKKK